MKFAPGEAVFDAGQRGNWRITLLAGRGDLLGAEALVQFQPADAAVACTPVVACRIPRELVDELCAQHPKLVRDLMRRWQAALEDAEREDRLD